MCKVHGKHRFAIMHKFVKEILLIIYELGRKAQFSVDFKSLE